MARETSREGGVEEKDSNGNYMRAYTDHGDYTDSIVTCEKLR